MQLDPVMKSIDISHHYHARQLQIQTNQKRLDEYLTLLGFPCALLTEWDINILLVLWLTALFSIYEILYVMILESCFIPSDDQRFDSIRFDLLEPETHSQLTTE